MKSGLLGALLFAVLGISQQAAAATISLINPSFETPNIGDGGSDLLVHTEVLNPSLQDWHSLHASSGTSIVLRDGSDSYFSGTSGSPGTLPGTADGEQYMRLFTNSAFTSATLKYIPSISAQSNTTYTLTVAVGQEISASGGSAHVALTLDGVDAAVVSLYDVITGIPNDTFIDLSTSFITGASDTGKTLGIELRAIGSGSVAFDNVRLTAVPIPAASWLFGSGLLGLLAIARRRKKTA